jgi:putative DNA methylase
MTAVKTRKKLIEVALPLDAINVASAREKSIRHGHPSTLHLWWARRPLAAARAVIFSQMVDDPSEYVDVLRSDPIKRRAAERELNKRLAQHQEKRALAGEGAIGEPEPSGCSASSRSWCCGRTPPTRRCCSGARRDLAELAAGLRRERRPSAGEGAVRPQQAAGLPRPFAGGGALPLEAQRLGLEAYASDLNPVAVLINKAMIEIPPKFAGQAAGEPRGAQGQEPVRAGVEGRAGPGRGRALLRPVDARRGREAHRPPLPEGRGHRRDGEGAAGPEALRGPQAHRDRLALGAHGEEPEPGLRQVDVPLASTFMLSTKAGKEAYVEPVIENGGYRFTVKVGKPKDAEAAKNGTKLSRGANFQCLMSGTPIAGDYIKARARPGAWARG